MKVIYSYLVTLLTLAVLDGIWLGVIAKQFYKENLGPLMRADMLWPVVILFYLLYAGAIAYFINSLANPTTARVIITGAILGFAVYMTYDLVNLATLKNWPTKVVVIDILWGTFLTAVAALAAKVLVK